MRCPMMLATSLLALAGLVESAAGAQNRPNQRGGRTETGAKVDRGHLRGRVVSYRGPADLAERDGTLVVAGEAGRQMTVVLTSKSRAEVGNADLSTRQALAYLLPGVEVTVDWAEERDPRTGGIRGKIGHAVRLRGQWIEGTIRSVNSNAIVAYAKPRERGRANRYERGNAIRAAGRRAPPERAAETESMRPQEVKLGLVNGLGAFSLDQRECHWEHVFQAWRQNKDLQFDAIVLVGGTNPVVELHARHPAAKPAAAGNTGPGGASNKRKEAEPKRRRDGLR